MNKIKSSRNTFPFSPFLAGKNQEGEKIAAGEKNYSCAEYTPLG